MATGGEVNEQTSDSPIISPEFIEVSTKADTKTCDISGSTLLPDNRLVVVDGANNMAKIVDLKLHVPIAKLKLSEAPHDIFRINDNQVAVTIPNEKSVVLVKVCGTVLKVDRTINVNGSCFGIDYRRDTLVLSFCFPPKVGVINMQGRVIREVTVDQQGRQIFEYPFNLTFGRDDSTLYVSDSARHAVCMNLDGTVVASYTDSNLRYPLGSVADMDGNIFVCGFCSHNIHKISTDCRKVQILGIDKELTSPQSISYSDTEGKLYLGFSGACGNAIQVYKANHGPL